MVDIHELLWEEITQAYPEAADLDPEELFPEEIYMGDEELAALFDRIEKKGVLIKSKGLETLVAMLIAWREKIIMTLPDEKPLNEDEARQLTGKVFSLMN